MAKVYSWKVVPRWNSMVSVACAALLICGPTVSAVSGRAHHKSLSRLKVGLVSVRATQEKVQDRLDDLKARESVLTKKSKVEIYPVRIPEMQPSLAAVEEAISSLESDKAKPLHKTLLGLYEDGHAQAISLLVGAQTEEAGKLSASEVRKGLSQFKSKKQVLALISKIEKANEEVSPKSSLMAEIELKKIRVERKALVKKLAKCQEDEHSILAEMAIVKGDQSEEVAQSDVEFAKPVPGKVTSAFGSRIHPIDHIEKDHKGIDFAGQVGDPVKSAADGKVIFAGEQRGFGKIVIVQHSNSLTTAYAHLSSFDVQPGEEVEKGQKIGEIGMTGNSTGPHLHFEIRENGDAVNPANYL